MKTLTSIIILMGIISIHSGISSLMSSPYLIHSSGVIGYFQTRPLHVEGRYIKNDLGQIVFLRGVNRAHYSDDCTGCWQPKGGGDGSGYGHWDETALRLHLEDMKNHGINLMRCHCVVDWWINNRATTLDGFPADRQYRPCIHDTIQIAEEYGIYVMIEWYGNKVQWPPIGQEPLPFPPYNYYPEVIGSIQDFVDFWVDVATELGGYPNVIFELWNEPVGDGAARDMWFDCVQRCIDAIRQITDTIIFVQWNYCAGFDWVWQYPINGTNIVYSNHIYRQPPGATIPVDMWEYNDIKNRLLTTWSYQYMLDNNLPFWIGEIGASRDMDDGHELEFFNNTLRILNEWEVGYAAWVWDHLAQGWYMQEPGSVTPFPLDEGGQILIDVISAGKT